MSDALASDVRRMEALARELGLDFYPVDFELAPASFMFEISVYGLPVRMPHWSFGVRYIHQLIRKFMGNSKTYEVMFPGNPGHAFLVESNSPAANTLVIAHVLGHADFAKNNQLFARFDKMSGGNIVEHAAAHAHRIEAAVREFGIARVEAVLDAALALEPNIDTERELYRQRYPARASASPPGRAEDKFQERFHDLPGAPAAPPAEPEPKRAVVPPYPEYDLLWFIAQYGQELEDWERDVFLAVREESFYFYPVFACQIMNEGWASYWHAPPAARSGVSAGGAVSVGDQAAFGRGQRVRIGRADRARGQSIPSGIPDVGEHHRKGGYRARTRDSARRGRFRIRAQLPRPRARRETGPVRIRGAAGRGNHGGKP
jgi:stage V sporulation protein R